MTKFALTAMLAAMLAFPDVAAAACTWSIVTSKNPHNGANDLFAVSATSSTDAWAVGFSVLSPLIEHWDGTGWSISHIPNTHSYQDQLLGVSADSPTDGWAVGNTEPSSNGVFVPLIEHRDATSWNIIANPNVGIYGGYLEGVVAFSPVDVWADGTMYTSSGGHSVTLIEHWNGSAWSIVNSPNVNSVYNTIYSLSATSPTDIWASGIYTPSASNLSIHQTLIEHYNGTNWSIVASPNKNAFSNNTNAIAAITPAAALATGDYYDGTKFQTLAEGWNGSAWSIKPSPNRGTSENDIFGMAAHSVTSAIAVGQYYPSRYTGTMAIKWNGTAWSSTMPRNLGPYDSYFNGAAVIPGTNDYWAVGGTSNIDFGYDKTLIEKYHC